MADQAAVSGGNGVRIHAPIESVVGNLAEFGNDVASLAELQAKLAVIDLKESAGKAALPAVLAATGLVLLLAGLPVALMGIAGLLVKYAGLSEGWAYLLTGGVVLVLAGALALLGLMRLRQSFTSFRRSQEEFARNLAWIRTVLVYSGRASAGRPRR